ncbi:MAG: cysteine--tRNA ligase [Microcoleaceae cyanobacterium]
MYNTQTRQKEDFTSITPQQVSMYCCGVTVYDYCHLGHARSYIAWDVVRRYLEWSGYQVTFVQNFTDIDDKILKRAKAEGTSMQAVSERYIEAYKEDMAQLNIREADAYPQATQAIPEIVALIQSLINQGYAYAVGGDVYYAVERFSSYGKLSGRSLEQMEAGASGRVDDAEPKKLHPMDFALWKGTKSEELDVYTPWKSPWGSGRPGWHIECSAMIQQAFEHNTIDIHAGGMDLVFPHHENEIAQSEAATQSPLAQYWMHNGFVNIQGVKMSKSLGNFTTIRDFLTQVEPMVIRLFVLQGNYRKPIDFTEEAINSAQNSWTTLQAGLLFHTEFGEKLGFQGNPVDRAQLNSAAIERFNTAMDDDFNTPGALAVLFELAKTLQREANLLTHSGKTETPIAEIQQTWQTLTQLAEVLGLKADPAAVKESTDDSGLSDAEIEDLIQQRQAARQAKNYAEGDRIRDELQAAGITLIDQPGGKTAWHR